MNNSEKWRPIEGFPKYEVSSLGRVRSVNTMNRDQTCILRLLKNPKGYLVVTIYSSTGKKCTLKVHRLVAMAFIEKTPKQRRINNLQINHKNCDKTDNRVENIEWCTQRENRQHAIENGLIKYGEDLSVKLSDQDVRKMRLLYSLKRKVEGKKWDIGWLANHYQVSPANVRLIVKGKSRIKYTDKVVKSWKVNFDQHIKNLME